MFENVAIRILVAIVIIALGFMVLKFLSAEKKNPVFYKAPANRKMQTRARLNLPKSILKKESAPQKTKNVSFAPSATDATLSEYGAWDTNRNSSSGIMNNLNSVEALTSGTMVPPMTTPIASSVNQLPSVPLLDGYSGDDGDMMFGEL